MGRLYAGNALIYAFDEAGDTIDLDICWPIEPLWLPSAKAVEAAIADRVIERPVMQVGSHVVWRWPQPQPATEAIEQYLPRWFG